MTKENIALSRDLSEIIYSSRVFIEKKHDEIMNNSSYIHKSNFILLNELINNLIPLIKDNLKNNPKNYPYFVTLFSNHEIDKEIYRIANDALIKDYINN